MWDIWAKGGVASYIRRVSEMQQQNGHTLFFFDVEAYRPAAPNAETGTHYVRDAHHLFALASHLKLDILHTHLVLPGDARPTVPMIRTIHGHQAYCPSGTRYLQREGVPCNRNYSLPGCLAGHLLDHCGSVRPGRMATEFRSTWREMRSLQQVPILTVSQFIKDQMVRAGYPADHIHVLYLPAPAAPEYVAPPSEGVPHFLFLGRLTPTKGVDWLLKAAQQVRTPVHIDIAGSGHEEPKMRQMAATLNVQDRVTFHGWVDGACVTQLLTRARALVFPSMWHEPGGTVAFEAMTNGRAVIMSRVGGMPEIVREEETGLLVVPGDVSALSDAVDRLAADWDLARQLGKQGRQMVEERFTLKQHCHDLNCLYERYAA